VYIGYIDLTTIGENMLTEQRFKELLNGALTGDAALTHEFFKHLYSRRSPLTFLQIKEVAERAIPLISKNAVAAVLQNYLVRCYGVECEAFAQITPNARWLNKMLDQGIAEGNSYAMYERALFIFQDLFGHDKFEDTRKPAYLLLDRAIALGNVHAKWYKACRYSDYNDSAPYEKIIQQEPEYYPAIASLAEIYLRRFREHSCSSDNCKLEDPLQDKLIPLLEKLAALPEYAMRAEEDLRYLRAQKNFASYERRKQMREEYAKAAQEIAVANQAFGELPTEIRQLINEKLNLIDANQETHDALQFILENASKLGHRACANEAEAKYPNAARNMPEIISALQQSVQSSRAYLHRALPLEPASLTTIEADADEILILIHRALVNEQYWKGVTPAQVDFENDPIIAMREYLGAESQAEATVREKLVGLQEIASKYVPASSQRLSFFGSDASMPTFFCRLVTRCNKRELEKFLQRQDAAIGQSSVAAKQAVKIEDAPKPDKSKTRWLKIERDPKIPDPFKDNTFSL
jgi:hypothetical protein